MDTDTREGPAHGARDTGRSAATMREVAERAGVSMMTVSRVINATAMVRPATREKVETAIAELNYRPNLGARRLAGGKSLFVGLLYHNPSPSYLSQVLLGGLAACRREGHHLVLEDFGRADPFSDPDGAVASLNTSDLDGLVVTPPLSGHPPLARALEGAGIPVVHIAPGDTSLSPLHVFMDDRAAMRDMVGHVLEAGHREVAFIHGHDRHPSSAYRYRGFVEGMRAGGLEVDADLIVHGDYTYRSGFEAARELLGRDPAPTAIVASNDDMAAGAVAAAYTAGLSVPGDVSVTGFDDTLMATNVWPELTTVAQPIADMAERAVRVLSAHLAGDDALAREAMRPMDYQIIPRASLGPHRGRSGR